MSDFDDDFGFDDGDFDAVLRAVDQAERNAASYPPAQPVHPRPVQPAGPTYQQPQPQRPPFQQPVFRQPALPPQTNQHHQDLSRQSTLSNFLKGNSGNSSNGGNGNSGPSSANAHAATTASPHFRLKSTPFRAGPSPSPSSSAPIQPSPLPHNSRAHSSTGSSTGSSVAVPTPSFSMGAFSNSQAIASLGANTSLNAFDRMANKPRLGLQSAPSAQNGSGQGYNGPAAFPTPYASPFPAAPEPVDQYQQQQLRPMHAHPVDETELKTWIYPTNYPVRDYQFNIVHRALFANTLVALPTGLGKTFLAAVVMFNYFRWFPKGKIMFMAPTKPLVAQQIEACFKITGIPQEATQELTGLTKSDSRESIWRDKRVFFLTPQVLQNDLRTGICPSKDVVLLVVDEAHRATGNHAYCEVVRELMKGNAPFRVLALSATPGSETKAVQAVIENLLIQTIEIRTEDSLDIRPYIFQRKVEEIVVEPTPEMTQIMNSFGHIMSGYLKRIVQARVYHESNPMLVTRFALHQARDRWRNGRSMHGNQGMFAAIEADIAVCMSLAALMLLLQQHGIRSFYTSLLGLVEEASDPNAKVSKARIQFSQSPDVKALLRYIDNLMKKPEFCSHVKLDRMTATILGHFAQVEKDAVTEPDGAARQTRVMIFSQFRESVDEIVERLNRHQPTLRVMSFIGQTSKKGSSAKGLTQKEQLEVISKFQSGNYNVLVATCIGEEGLDIGEVDLIICYDAQTSPIRMLQRMGRTGRKRQGRIVVLLSKGREEENHKSAQSKYKSVQRAIMEGQGKRLLMYQGPAGCVLPQNARPVCDRKTLVIPEYSRFKILPGGPGKRGRGKSAKDADEAGWGAGERAALLDEDRQLYASVDPKTIDLSLGRFTHWQTRPLSDKVVSRSLRSKVLVRMMQLCETLANDEETGLPCKDVEQMMHDLDWGPSGPRLAGMPKPSKTKASAAPAAASSPSAPAKKQAAKRLSMIFDLPSSGEDDVDFMGNDKTDRLLMKDARTHLAKGKRVAKPAQRTSASAHDTAGDDTDMVDAVPNSKAADLCGPVDVDMADGTTNDTRAVQSATPLKPAAVEKPKQNAPASIGSAKSVSGMDRLAAFRFIRPAAKTPVPPAKPRPASPEPSPVQPAAVVTNEAIGSTGDDYGLDMLGNDYSFSPDLPLSSPPRQQPQEQPDLVVEPLPPAALQPPVHVHPEPAATVQVEQEVHAEECVEDPIFPGRRLTQPQPFQPDAFQLQPGSRLGPTFSFASLFAKPGVALSVQAAAEPVMVEKMPAAQATPAAAVGNECTEFDDIDFDGLLDADFDDAELLGLLDDPNLGHQVQQHDQQPQRTAATAPSEAVVPQPVASTTPPSLSRTGSPALVSPHPSSGSSVQPFMLKKRRMVVESASSSALTSPVAPPAAGDSALFKTPRPFSRLGTTVAPSPLQNQMHSEQHPPRGERNPVSAASTPDTGPRVAKRLRPRVLAAEDDEDDDGDGNIGQQAEPAAQPADDMDDDMDDGQDEQAGHQRRGLLQRTPLLERLAMRKQPRKPPRQRGTPVLTTTANACKSRSKPSASAATKPRSKSRKQAAAGAPNPFLDLEAVLSSEDGSVSSDEASDDDEDDAGDGATKRRFVVSDGEMSSQGLQSQAGSQASQGGGGGGGGGIHAFYRTSLLSPGLGGLGRKHGAKFRFADHVGRYSLFDEDEEFDEEYVEESDYDAVDSDDEEDYWRERESRKQSELDDKVAEWLCRPRRDENAIKANPVSLGVARSAVADDVEDDDFDGPTLGINSMRSGARRQLPVQQKGQQPTKQPPRSMPAPKLQPAPQQPPYRIPPQNQQQPTATTPARPLPAQYAGVAHPKTPPGGWAFSRNDTVITAIEAANIDDLLHMDWDAMDSDDAL
ncbi:hypothetical protein BC831DRAFT_508680 [Entophlyctis helioformis]|nr:hypothetical protein BC831DRAFT_508680 [Entophlyctis helioformis]